jgi:hypothetical protein
VIDAGQFIAISHKAARDPFPAWYCPTITPALLIPSTDVNAPGTLTVVNLKVKVGASAAVAAITNNNTDRTSSNVLPLFIVFPPGKFP